MYSVLINPDMQYNKQMLHRTFHASSLRCAKPLTLWVYVEEGRCLCRDVLLLLLSCVFLKSRHLFCYFNLLLSSILVFPITGMIGKVESIFWFTQMCVATKARPAIVKPPTRLGAVDAAYGHDKLWVRPPKLMDIGPGHTRITLKPRFSIKQKSIVPYRRKVTVFQPNSEQIP